MVRRYAQLYRYVNGQGSVVFTNGWEQIPPAYRSSATPLSLAGASVTSVQRTEFETSVLQQEQALAASPLCQKAMVSKDGLSWSSFRELRWETVPWRMLYQEYGHLLATGAVMLLLLLATPFVLRSMDTPTWARFLTTSFQILAVLGLVTHAVMSIRKGYSKYQDLADPCAQLSASAASGGSGNLLERLSVI